VKDRVYIYDIVEIAESCARGIKRH